MNRKFQNCNLLLRHLYLRGRVPGPVPVPAVSARARSPRSAGALSPMHIPVLLAGFLCGPWWAHGGGLGGTHAAPQPGWACPRWSPPSP